MIFYSEQERIEIRNLIEDLNDSDREFSLSEILTLKSLSIGLGIKNIKVIMEGYN